MDKKKRRRRGSGSVIKRGNIYWLYHTRSGKLQGESLGTSSKQEADQLARKRLREIDDDISGKRVIARSVPPYIEETASTGTFPQQLLDTMAKGQKQQQDLALFEKKLEEMKANPTLDEFWKLGDKLEDDTGLYPAWCRRGKRARNTLISYRTAWSRFRRYFKTGVNRMGDITPQIAKQYETFCAADKVGSRNHKGVSIEGITQYVVCMQGMFATALSEGWLRGTNPFHVRYQLKRDRVIEVLRKEQVTKLLEEARKLEDDTIFLFISIAIYTGMRKDEIANLTWQDVDLEKRVVKVQAKREDKENGIQAFQVKSKQARVIPVREELLATLKPLRKESGYVIQPGKKIKRARWSIPKEFELVTKKTGVKCNPHLFRHTFATWAIEAGRPIFAVSKWLGHSTIQTTVNIYVHNQEGYNPEIEGFDGTQHKGLEGIAVVKSNDTEEEDETTRSPVQLTPDGLLL